MRFKHLIILGLILTILTIGAVSASENITDDQLAVEDEANIYGNSPEDELAEVQYVDGFGVEFQQSIALNSESELLWVNNYDHLDGNLKININDNPAPAYNKKLSDTVEVKLADLGITSMGNYKIAASFQPTNGNQIKLLDSNFNVTENEGMEYVSVLMYDVYHPDSEFITIYHPALTGYFQIYIDDMLVYNKTNPERIFLNQLDKRPPWGKHLVKVTYDDGNKITLVKSKYVVFGYYIALNYDESMMVGKDMDFYITLPYDADGDLYLTVDGKSQKISYSNGVAEYKFNTDELEISKWYNFTLELRNDSFYPLLTDQVEFFTFLNILHFDYSSVGEKEVVGLCLPKKYNGVFKLYNAKEVKDDYVKTGKAIGTCKVVNGLASITLSGLSKGEHTFIAEFTSGGKTYEDVFSITVKKNSGKFTSSIDSNIVKIGYSVVVKITSSLKGSNEFDIYVDGVFNQTVKVGKGSVKVPFFFTTVGKHSIKVINYESGSKTPFHSNTFIVNVKSASSKDIVKLAIKKVKVKKSAKKLVLKATLKINGIAKKGLKVKFKFNKKKYTAKTNKKGVAKVTIKKKVLKKLKVGKKVKIQASYGKTVKKIKVKVKR